MSEYTNFRTMTRADAKEFLDLFLDQMQAALGSFASATGCELTYSPDSLEDVWSAIVPKLAWRSGYTPPGIGQPGPRITPEQVEPPQDLPAWFHHPSGVGYARFSAETLWLIDGAARYLGDVAIRTVGGHWASGNSPDDRYIFQNQPVVAGLRRDPLSPIQTCAALAARALQKLTEAGPRTLADVYGTWCYPKH
jgi:hypothetical protein